MKGRFFILPNELFTYENISHSEFLVFSALISFKNNKEKTITVKMKTLAHRTGLSVVTIARSIKKLKDNKLIAVIPKFYEYSGYYKRGTNIYILKKFTGKFTRIPLIAFEKNLSSTEFITFCYLLKCSNNNLAYPSLTEISKNTNISIPTIISNLNSLVAYKLIIKKYYIGKFHSFCRNQYSILSNYINTNMQNIAVKINNKIIYISCYTKTQINLQAQFEYLKKIVAVRI